MNVEEQKSPMILAQGVVKIYKTKEVEVVALKGLDLTVEKGELMAIIGNSGSGKSTLLNMLGGLDRPSAGTLMVDGKNLLRLSESQLIEYRRSTVGFVWQNNARNLVPYLDAEQNVMLPMTINNTVDKEWVNTLFDTVGLSHRRHSKLNQMSGGEQQRVAIAIALANKPPLLLADEPTGAVDTQTSNNILELFKRINRELGVTVVIVTHDTKLRQKVDRVVAIRDGITSSEFIMRSAYREQLDKLTATGDVTLRDLAQSHEELVVADTLGRVQLPREYLELMGIGISGGKLRAEFSDSKIILSPFENTSKKER